MILPCPLKPTLWNNLVGRGMSHSLLGTGRGAMWGSAVEPSGKALARLLAQGPLRKGSRLCLVRTGTGTTAAPGSPSLE